MMKEFSWRRTEKENRDSTASIRAPAIMARTPSEPVEKARMKTGVGALVADETSVTPMSETSVLATKAATAV